MNLRTTSAPALILCLAASAAWAAQPAATPAPAAKPATAMPAAAAKPGTLPPLSGVVTETMDAGPYTYMLLKIEGGEIWAAVLQAPVKKGQKVTVDNPMVMQNFKSKTLNRSFDQIVFGTLAGTAPKSANVTPADMTPQAAGAAASPHAGMGGAAGSMPPSPHAMGGGAAAGMPASPHAMGANAAAAKDVPMEKLSKAAGPDGRTVAEAYAQAKSLNGKEVVMHVKVVKYLPGIMGKTWVHLRDGTGSAADGTNDLVGTTKQTVAVGDVVTARGVLRADVDVGMGAEYKVLLENATFQK